MIVSKGTKPEYSLYFLGAEILKAHKEIGMPMCDAFQLYEIIKRSKVTYTYSQHLMALNWLFLLDAVNITANGRLAICS